MKFQLSRAEGANRITGCGEGFVTVNDVRYDSSLIVTSDRVVPDWPVASFAALAPDHLAALLDANPEVVLLGTGQRLRFPPAAVLRPLVESGIGYEVMDTGAACRTYGILVAEGRRVVAALIVGIVD